jgi:hypothetical protein
MQVDTFALTPKAPTSSAKRTTENGPPIHRWVKRVSIHESMKRTAEGEEPGAVMAGS